jgi:multiple sugar transport system substrate-binding protein
MIRRAPWGWLLAAALVASACGGDDGGSTADTTAPSETVTDSGDPDEPGTDPADDDDDGDGDGEPVTTEPAPIEFEDTELTLWSSFADEPSIAAFRPIIDRCEAEHPWLTIKYVGKDQLSTALAAATEAGRPPDLVQGDFSGGLARIEASGLAVTVDELAERDGIDWEQFVPGSVKMVTFNGQRYGLPLSVDTAALFYNQDALDEGGIGAPPATFDELYAAAQQLLVVDSDGRIQRIGFVPDVGDGSFVTYSGALFGGGLFSEDGTRVTLTETDAWEQGFNWQRQFYDLFDDSAFQRFVAGFGSYDSSENFFITGELALYLEASYFITWPSRFGQGEPENWGVVPMPGPEGVADPEDFSLIAGGNWFMIPRGVKDVEASWAAMKCMALASEEVASFEQFIGNIPANVAALDLFEEYELARLPAYQTFIDLARSPNAEVPRSSVIIGSATDELTSLALSYRRGDFGPDELPGRLAALEQRLQQELDLELGN